MVDYAIKTPPQHGTWQEFLDVWRAADRAGMHHRHPAVTANMAVTVDHISNGRFDLGLGAGWMEDESEAYGIPLGTPKERSDRFEDPDVKAMAAKADEFGDAGVDLVVFSMRGPYRAADVEALAEELR